MTIILNKFLSIFFASILVIYDSWNAPDSTNINFWIIEPFSLAHTPLGHVSEKMPQDFMARLSLALGRLSSRFQDSERKKCLPMSGRPKPFYLLQRLIQKGQKKIRKILATETHPLPLLIRSCPSVSAGNWSQISLALEAQVPYAKWQHLHMIYAHLPV